MDEEMVCQERDSRKDRGNRRREEYGIHSKGVVLKESFEQELEEEITALSREVGKKSTMSERQKRHLEAKRILVAPSRSTIKMGSGKPDVRSVRKP